MIIFIYYLIQTTRRRIKAKTRRRARAMSRSMVTWVKVTLKRGMASNKVAEPHTWQLQTKLATILSYLKEKICQAPMQDFLFWRVQGLPKIHWLKFIWELLGRTSWCQRERSSGLLQTFVQGWGRHQKKNTELFGNFSQHTGGGSPQSQNFCDLTK